MFTYLDDGRRVPFDPSRVRQQIPCCLLCGGPTAGVGVFLPYTATMQAAVLRLRQHPVRERSSMTLAYGLCYWHAADPDYDRVEAVILAAAERVRVQ